MNDTEATMSSGLSADGNAPKGDAFVFPTSFGQRRLWFLDQLEPDSSAYNISFATRLIGSVNTDALQAALDDLVARHETLRTSFDVENDEPVQLIEEHGHIKLQVTNSDDPAEDAIAHLLAQFSNQSFDLRHGPLLKAHLIKTSKNQSILFFSIHHIIADAWSLGVLYRELVGLYELHSGNSNDSLDALEIQYGDFAEWQQEWMQGEDLQKQLNYWKERLSDAPPVLELPIDRPRPRLQTHNGATLSRELSPALATSLRLLAQSEQCTLFILLLAAYDVLLMRYSGSDDIVVGTPIAGRGKRELEPLIGFFVNTLAMRADLSGNPAFTELLQQTKRDSLNAYRNQDVPFEKLVEELQPDRVMSYSPVFQTLFVLEHSATGSSSFSELTAEAVRVKSDTAKFDVSLFVSESADALSCTFEYNTDLFDTATIERMLNHFDVLLQSIAANPSVRIGDIQLLSASELDTVTRSFNDTACDFGTPQAVHHLIEKQVTATPNQIAIEAHEANDFEMLSYQELNRRANRLAHELIAQGVMPGNLIAISYGRSIEMAIATLAVLKAGAAYVPVDPHYPNDRITYMLEDSAATLLLTSSAADETETKTLHLDQFDFTTGNGSNPDIVIAADAPLYTIYTSGSTGLPKGVVLAHAGLSNLLHWQQMQNGLRDPARTLQFASLSFDVSFQELFSTWAQGGTLVMISEELRKDLAALAVFVSERSIERLYMPFAALQPLADAFAERSDLQLKIKDIISAGEQLQVTPAIRTLFKRCKGRLHNQYGPSETHVVTSLSLDTAVTTPDNWPLLPSIGHPVANTRCYILDANQRPVAVGLAGELYLAGVQVALQYLGRPELTTEQFSDDPYMPGERMYRSGDRARYKANGEIEYLGRVDEQVKFRGFRIEPAEIEAIIGNHPGVQLAAVVLKTGAEKKLVAYVCPEPGHEISGAVLRDFAKAQLPDYMNPTHYVVLEAMPLTPSGKISRRLLPEPSWERDAESRYIAPRTPTEEILVNIWCEVLDVEQLGIDDDFFDLGGHSLLATQVISRIRSKLNIEVPLMRLFEEPTIRGFGQFISSVDSTDTTNNSEQTIPRRKPGAATPLSFAQQRLWFLEQLDPGNPAYNFPIATRFTGELNRSALSSAINGLIARHESLRTRFVADGQMPRQEILESASIAFEVLDMTAATAGEVQDKLTALSQQPFDLTQAPLLRANLLELNSQENILLLATHHIVSDGWSLSVLFSDLTELYNSISANTENSLSALPVQYADFANWQREWFDDEELKRQLDFWRSQLKGADPVLALPTDKPRPAELSYRGSSTAKLFGNDVSAAIKALAQDNRATLFMTLLAAFNTLLARYARQEHVVIGTPIAGRKYPELEPLIGFFSNTLAIHSDLSGDPSFIELLEQVKSSTLQAYDHQDLPFEKLVEELSPERDMSHTPIFQTMFVLQNTPAGSSTFNNVAAESVNFEMGIAKFDLLLEVSDTGKGLRAGLQYNEDLFLPHTIERMLEHFENLLNSIVEQPKARLSELQLIDRSETQTVLQRFNNTGVDYGAFLPPQQAVEQQARSSPDACALEFGAQKLSYATLNTQANVLAQQLIAAGAKPGVFIGLCAERSIAAVVSLLAILKTGAAYLPIDPDYPADRIAYMISNSKVPLLLSDSKTAAKLPANNAQVILLDKLDWAANNIANPKVKVAPEDPLYAIYTSGSTGTPKGAVLPQRALANLLAWQVRRPGFEHAARTLQYASLSFDVHHQEIFPTWASGGTLVLIDQEMRQDLPALVRFISEANIQRLWMPFAALQPTAEIMAQRDDLEFSLEQICTSGEQLQVTPLIRKFFSKYPEVGFHNEYGPSEAHVVSIYNFSPGAERWAELPPIGKPVPNTRLYILDMNMQPCPVGVPGELYIAGKQLGLSYLNQPEETVEKFIDDPFTGDAGRMYKTGDLARFLADGNISYMGRVDEQFKFRGFRIEPGEIEAALANSDKVKLAAVALREDNPGDKRLVGYVTTEPGTVLDIQQLKVDLQSRLPEYMIPSTIVVLDTMPTTPSGKISRLKLPVPDTGWDTESYVAPRNELETSLMGLWEDVLSVEKIGIHDDFFELGGHSLLATQLISRIRDIFQLEMPLKYIFRYPTVARLSEQISALTLMANQLSTDDMDDDDDLEEFEI